jgi:hypothetical protein
MTDPKRRPRDPEEPDWLDELTTDEGGAVVHVDERAPTPAVKQKDDGGAHGKVPE